MRRLAIGCLGVFAVLFVAGGIVAYVYLWRPAQQMVASVQQFQELGELDRQVQARGDYAPPENGLLAESQVERYLRVQQDMLASLEGEYQQLQTRIEAMDAQQGLAPRQWLEAYKDIFDLVADAKRAQVQALNQNDFSLSEYQWVRARTLEALGMSSYATFDLQELVSSAAEAEAPVETTTPTVPPENIELVDRYEQELDEVIGFAMVGL